MSHALFFVKGRNVQTGSDTQANLRENDIQFIQKLVSNQIVRKE